MVADMSNSFDRGPTRFEGDRPRFGDRDGYRGGPRGAPGDFGGERRCSHRVPAIFQGKSYNDFCHLFKIVLSFSGAAVS
jgi:hypothetical protein